MIASRANADEYARYVNSIYTRYAAEVESVQECVRACLYKGLGAHHACPVVSAALPHGVWQPLATGPRPVVLPGNNVRFSADGKRTLVMAMGRPAAAAAMLAYWDSLHAVDPILAKLTQRPADCSSADARLHMHRLLKTDATNMLGRAERMLETALAVMRESLVRKPD
jgi:hypothetical protein